MNTQAIRAILGKFKTICKTFVDRLVVISWPYHLIFTVILIAINIGYIFITQRTSPLLIRMFWCCTIGQALLLLYSFVNYIFFNLTHELPRRKANNSTFPEKTLLQLSFFEWYVIVIAILIAFFSMSGAKFAMWHYSLLLLVAVGFYGRAFFYAAKERSVIKLLAATFLTTPLFLISGVSFGVFLFSLHSIF